MGKDFIFLELEQLIEKGNGIFDYSFLQQTRKKQCNITNNAGKWSPFLEV
jgi:hypothetical protein